MQIAQRVRALALVVDGRLTRVTVRNKRAAEKRPNNLGIALRTRLPQRARTGRNWCTDCEEPPQRDTLPTCL